MAGQGCRKGRQKRCELAVICTALPDLMSEMAINRFTQFEEGRQGPGLDGRECARLLVRQLARGLAEPVDFRRVTKPVAARGRVVAQDHGIGDVEGEGAAGKAMWGP